MKNRFFKSHFFNFLINSLSLVDEKIQEKGRNWYLITSTKIVPNTGSWHIWLLAQPFTSDDDVQNARGRVLGGSSAINVGFYSRADDDFYKKSKVNWDLRVVNQSYKWVEKAIVFRPELKNWQSPVRDGLLEVGVDPYIRFSLDHSVGTKIGGSTFDSIGKRYSAIDQAIFFFTSKPSLWILFLLHFCAIFCFGRRETWNLNKNTYLTLILTEVGYGKQMGHTSGGLSDTFKTIGRQSDFRPNHRWV